MDWLNAKHRMTIRQEGAERTLSKSWFERAKSAGKSARKKSETFYEKEHERMADGTYK